MDKRINVLDGLRGIAVLMVLVQHLIEKFPILQTSPDNAFAYVLQNYLNFGRVGVIVFFLISGYLIPFTLREGPRAATSFWVSRFFRLYPLYWVSLGLALFTFTIWPAPYEYSTLDALFNVTMLQTAVGSPNVLEPYWTLFIELIFYVLCVVAFVARLNRVKQPVYFILFFAAIVAMTSLVSLAGDRVPQGLLQKVSTFGIYLMIMFFGTFLRTLEMHDAGRGAWLYVLPAIAVALGSYTVARYGWDFNRLLSPLSVLFSTLFAFAVFLLRDQMAWLLRQSWLVFVGTVSYGLYLFHPITLHVFDHLLPNKQSFVDFTVLAAAVIVSALILSYAGYRLLEAPMIEVGKHVRKRLTQTAKVTSTAG